MRIGWAESSCDYYGLVKSNGYTSALVEIEESEDTLEEEDKEEEVQEDEKEAHDQENVEEEIEEDNENIEEFKKSSKNIEIPSIEIPIDDLLDNPAIAGIGFAVFFLGGVVCVLKCCAPNKRRRKKNRYRKEIEIGRSSYRDNFKDEV